MTIKDFLSGLGLEQYIAVFEENDVDFDTLSSFTDSDLKELGITSFGHRKKILSSLKNDLVSNQEISPSKNNIETQNNIQVNIENSSGKEKEYYSKNGVLITNRRIVTSEGRTIAIGQVNSVKTQEVIINEVSQPSELPFIVAAVAAVILMPTCAEVGNQINLQIPGEQSNGPYMLLGIALVICSYFLVPNRSKIIVEGQHYFSFSIETSSGGTSGFNSPDRLVIDEMVASLNKAIVENLS